MFLFLIIFIVCAGQIFTHSPQRMHFSWSTTGCSSKILRKTFNLMSFKPLFVIVSFGGRKDKSLNSSSDPSIAIFWPPKFLSIAIFVINKRFKSKWQARQATLSRLIASIDINNKSLFFVIPLAPGPSPSNPMIPSAIFSIGPWWFKIIASYKSLIAWPKS